MNEREILRLKRAEISEHLRLGTVRMERVMGQEFGGALQVGRDFVAFGDGRILKTSE